MTVSVIIPTYNRIQSVEKAIHSVFAQSYEEVELIVVDDGSTDGTWEQLLPYHHCGRLRLVQQPQSGVSAARNKGASLAQGQWLAFLDSDDEWLVDKLMKQMEWLAQNSDIPVIHGEEIWVRNGTRVNPAKKHQKRGGWIFTDSLRHCAMGPSTVVIKKEFFLEQGGFRDDFPVCEDYQLWLHITSQTPVGFIEDPVIVKYGGHEDQLSRQRLAMSYYRVLALEDILGSQSLSESWRCEAIKELKYKTDILLKGYLKHDNMIHYDRVLSIQSQWC